MTHISNSNITPPSTRESAGNLSQIAGGSLKDSNVSTDLHGHYYTEVIDPRKNLEELRALEQDVKRIEVRLAKSRV